MSIHKALGRVRAAARYGREHGLVALARRSLFSVRNSPAFARQRPLQQLDFLQHAKGVASASDSQAASNTVNWFIPMVGRGSGGHLNIFRFVRMLEESGFDCRIVIADEAAHMTSAGVKAEIDAWFMPLRAQVYMSPDESPAAAISIATGWKTAYFLRGFQRTQHKCYFVQDYEPWFYEPGSFSALAEETYRFGFTGITAGSWLAEKLSSEFGMRTNAVGFSYDEQLYRPGPPRHREGRKVFFYARPSTPRRGFTLGVAALAEVVRRLPDTVVAFAGSDLAAYDLPFRHENHGVMDVKDLPALYNECDVALVLSFTNLSLLPLELMACGVPVVSNRAPNATWLLNDDIARLADATVDALADAICFILEDKEFAAGLAERGRAAAEATDWAREGARMSAVLREL